MSQDISQVIGSYIYQEQALQNQLNQLYSEKDNIKTEIGKEVITEIAKGYFGRTGGKLARKAVTTAKKELLRVKEQEIETRHQQIIFNVKSLLDTVSEWKQGIKQPNSRKLVSQIQTAQRGVRIATRIRATINALSSIQCKKLIYNSEIPVQEPTSMLVDAGSPFSASLELRKILSSVTDYILIIDPYLDIKTLEILLVVPDNVPIKFLTENTGGKRKVNSILRSCRDFKIEKPLFELRKSHGLHDRFVISRTQGWSVGTSLKDFGKRISALSSLSEPLKKDVEKKFYELWKKSEILIN